ncbi:PepSY-associated TM helix domain-containing protein [Solilutibacter pythonis]|uniref:PepSY-associated TM helix domain-containing protein n=1 Tax=Solilutibacter pythonis TaxID=2483112 RepID=UPI001314BBE6|nr:PepSY-associated TM helix domain-containing protein [Lysobacter pythonis]
MISHSWLGLIGSWVLFLVFFTGALTMFKREIDLWEKAPEYLGSQGRAVASLDSVLAATQVPSTVRDPHIEVLLPGRLSAYYQVFVYDDEGDYYRADAFHPVTGKLLPAPELTGLGEFLEEFHKELYLPLGHYLVGLVTFIFFLGLVTGLVLYWPKLSWASLTSIRWKRPRMRWLDLHNSVGVFGFPFHLLMAFTGTILNLALLISLVIVWGRLDGNSQPLMTLLFPPALQVPVAGEPMVLRGSDGLIHDAEQQFGLEPLRVSVHHFGDRNAMLTVHGHGVGSFARTGQITYQVHDRTILRALHPAKANALAHGYEVVFRLHYGDFGGLALRLLYFILALASCLLIATGNLLWLEKRLAQRKPPRGLRLVAALSVGSCGGVILAMAVAMWTTRLIPIDAATRMDWVIGAFATILLAGPFVGWWVRRPRHALICLLLAAAVLFALLPLLDWLRFGKALMAAIGDGDGAVALVHMLCMGLAASCAMAARWLARDNLQGANLRYGVASAK